MNESGVLGRFIPDFGRLVGQMQFDLYHSYTVDEHILVAIGNLHRLETGEGGDLCSMAQELFAGITARRVLYLAVFCHDIAKGRGGSHHLKGIAIGRKLARRFGFDKAEQKTLSWLIEYHQHLSMIAFKRDLEDPQVIRQLADTVQTVERLKMLYLITLADIQAVGPGILNSWKVSLLETLYHRTEQKLTGEAPSAEPEVSVDALQHAMLAALPEGDAASIAAYVQQADMALLAAYDAPTHARIFSSWHAVTSGEKAHLRFQSYADQDVTHVTIATRDQHGLFAQIVGVLAVCGASITDARIYTGKDGIVIDRFSVQDEQGTTFEEERRQARIRERFFQVLDGNFSLEKGLEKAEKHHDAALEAFQLEPVISFDDQSSRHATLVEVECLDKRGLLYTLASLFSGKNLNISRAHIATYGEKVVDVFYLTDAWGQKLSHAVKRQLLEEIERACR